MSANHIAGGSAELERKIEEWLTWDKNEKTRAEIEDCVRDGSFTELSEKLLNRVSFGTAGIRGKMEAGYNGMNDLVVLQTGQGLLKYLEETDGELLKSNGIVVGYDGRHNSKRFAHITASIFLHKNYPVHIFSDVVPTPFVPFTVSSLKCAAGVMVTASHNPKEDNGYKVYGSNGAQIISPADKNIQRHILENLEPLASSWEIEIVNESAKVHNPLAQITTDYINTVSSEILEEHIAIAKNTELKFTYTAMHGVGYKYLDQLFQNVGLRVIPVEEQKDPDPDFPTVKFPNPEEGKSSLDLSFQTANANNSTIILANDPDADRLAVAEKDNSSDKWRVFNGNELGALLGWWSLHCHQAKRTSESLNDCYVISSTVSSKILRSIARAEGLNFLETLTGFKWMGNKSHELIEENKKVIFAFEEAIGFMCGSTVLDKDGINAAVQMAIMAAYLHHHGLTLTQQLAEIYQEYGYHVSNNSYYICHDALKIKKIFDRLRNYDGPNTYPKGVLQNKYQICSVRDLTTGFDDTQPDNKAVLPVSNSSQMITFSFTNGLVATLRTSGTEPKIKYYTELCASPTQTNTKEIETTLEEMVNGIVSEFLQPVENDLIPRSE